MSISSVTAIQGQRTETHIRKETTHESGGSNGTKDLCNEDDECSHIRQAADQCETQSDSRIEQATADAEEDPSIHSQAEAKSQGDVKKCRCCRSDRSGDRIGDMSAGESEEQKEKCSHELAEELDDRSAAAETRGRTTYSNEVLSTRIVHASACTRQQDRVAATSGSIGRSAAVGKGEKGIMSWRVGVHAEGRVFGSLAHFLVGIWKDVISTVDWAKWRRHRSLLIVSL